MTTNRIVCDRCGHDGETYWTCCGGPGDGSSGGTCQHNDAERICEKCWDAAEKRGELSTA